MQTIKTATVVVLLLAVLYGVYVVLNKPAWPPNHPLAWTNRDSEWDRESDEWEGVRVQVRGDDDASETESGAGATDAGWTSFHSQEKTADGLPKVEIKTESLAAKRVHRSLTDEPSVAESSPANTPGTDTPGIDTPGIDPPAFLPPPENSGFVAASTDSVASSAQARESSYAAQRTAVLAEAKSTPAPELKQPELPSPELPSAEADVGGAPAEQPVTKLFPPAPSTVETASVADARPGAARASLADDSPATPKAGPPSEFASSNETPSVKAIRPFERALSSAKGKIEAEQIYEALLTLSVVYDDEDLSESERQELLDYLDPLAARVVYSTEHLVEPPYRVAAGETLETIAAKHSIPVQLLQNINGLSDQDALPPGTLLKVVTGPFRAEINRERKELTLFVKRLYAGRFPVELAATAAEEQGEFQIAEKSPGRIHVSPDGSTIPADDPLNPYGGVWMGLNEHLSLHGSATQTGNGGPVSIGLAPDDAVDLYGILSQGSHVIIR